MCGRLLSTVGETQRRQGRDPEDIHRTHREWLPSEPQRSDGYRVRRADCARVQPALADRRSSAALPATNLRELDADVCRSGWPGLAHK